MSKIKKRRLKIRWRILLTVLPFAIIPLALIVIFIRYSLFSYMENQKLILNDTLLYQIDQNIEKKYNDDNYKTKEVIKTKEINDLLFLKEYKDKAQERKINDWIENGYKGKGGLTAKVQKMGLAGKVYIVNRNRASKINDTPYSYWEAGDLGWNLKIGKFLESSALEKSIEFIKNSNQGSETGNVIYIKPPSIAMPIFTYDVQESERWYTLMLPLFSDKKKARTGDFDVFVLVLQNNRVFEEFFPKVIKEDTLSGDGTIYILDYKNESIYSNMNVKDLEVKLSTDRNVIFDSEIQDVLKGSFDKSKYTVASNKSVVIDFRYNKMAYQTLLLDSKEFENARSGIKILYFYPKDLIYMPIYIILVRIFIISSVILLFVVFFSIMVSNSLAYPLVKLDYATNKVSQGYYDVNIVSDSRDEIGHLYRNFKRMINTHIEVLTNIKGSADDLIGYQNTLDRVISDFDNTLQGQAQTIQESSSTFEALDRSIIQVARNVNEALGIIEEAQKQSDNTTIIINEMENEINKMAETSQEINFITELINGISEKTRLLSLNAAIEASRAGEAGKGFSVVATEIRNLASQANEAANQIGVLIKENEKRIQSGVSKTTDVIDALGNINSNVKMITNIVNRINEEAREESKGSHIILDIINTFSEKSTSNLQLINEVGRVRGLLNMEVERMRNIVHSFKIKSENQEVIRDVKIVTQEERKRTKEERQLKNKVKNEQKKEAKEKKRMKIIKDKSSDKLENIRAISLYRPKRSIFNFFKKK